MFRRTPLKPTLHLRLFYLLILSAFVGPAAARAQYAVGVAFTAQHLLVNPGPATTEVVAGNTIVIPVDSSWVYGPTFSLQAEYGHHIKSGFDIRSSLLRGNSFGDNSIGLGYRLAIPISRLHCKPYGEYLFGVIEVRNGESSTNYTGHLDNQFIVGVDSPLRHHLDWRVLEYSYGQIFATAGFSGEDVRQQLSSGLLVRF